MIPEHHKDIDDLILEEDQRERRMKTLTRATIGAGLAVSLSIFALKWDMATTYTGLSERITELGGRVEQLAPLHYDSIGKRLDDATYRLDNLEHDAFILKSPCYDSVSAHVTEVRGC